MIAEAKPLGRVFTIVDTTCKDHDEDCPGIRDKVACYLYDPGRGMCPYLRTPTERTADGS